MNKCINELKRRAMLDAWVMSTATLAWERIVDGTDPGVPCRPFAKYLALGDRRIFRVTPEENGKLTTLETIDIELPEDIWGKIHAKESERAEEMLGLELLDDVKTTPNSIELQWRMARATYERVDHFKLMMASTQGVVKEVCRGKFKRYKVTNLRSNTDYIFCVKGIFDDGSHIWSDSKSFTTSFVRASPSRSSPSRNRSSPSPLQG